MAIVFSIITLVVLIIIAANALMPALRDSTSSLTETEILEKDSPEDNSTALQGVTSSDTVTGISISGLTSPANYTLDTDLQQVNWTNATTAGNYSSTVTYITAQYLSNTRDRALMAVTLLLVAAGLVYLIGRMFGFM